MLFTWNFNNHRSCMSKYEIIIGKTHESLIWAEQIKDQHSNHKETNQLICRVNQLTRFFTIRKLVVKELTKTSKMYSKRVKKDKKWTSSLLHARTFFPGFYHTKLFKKVINWKYEPILVYVTCITNWTFKPTCTDWINLQP